MAVTIKDVAKETNLAISTISKYMNGGTVRAENRELIEAAIQKLGYLPNRSARGLRTSKAYMIGLITGRVSSPHTAAIISEIEKKFRLLGYSVTFATHEENGIQAKDYVDYMVERGVDGVISTPIGSGRDYLKSAVEKNIPVLLLEEHWGDIRTDCVPPDAGRLFGFPKKNPFKARMYIQRFCENLLWRTGRHCDVMQSAISKTYVENGIILRLDSQYIFTNLFRIVIMTMAWERFSGLGCFG